MKCNYCKELMDPHDCYWESEDGYFYCSERHLEADGKKDIEESSEPTGSNAKFEREDRYLVIKRKDIKRYLTPTERNILMELTGKIYLDRMEEDRGGLRCVVVEHDWPEYEPTWAAIQARVEGQ